MTACLECGNEIPPPIKPQKGGHPRLYCDLVCQRRASNRRWRQRHPNGGEPGRGAPTTKPLDTSKPYGRLTVVRVELREVYISGRGRCRRSLAVCDCLCGTQGHLVAPSALRAEKVRSCGCLQRQIARELGHRTSWERRYAAAREQARVLFAEYAAELAAPTGESMPSMRGAA